MTWLAELFETNRIIVLSVYGQVFFVMGLAIALQSRRRSQLPLARPLGWLAAFGLLHGLMIWGYLFVPIQAGWLPAPAVEALLVLQLLMKPLSFALLFQFGVELWLATRDPDRPVATFRGQPLAALRAGRLPRDVGGGDDRPFDHGAPRASSRRSVRGCRRRRSATPWRTSERPSPSATPSPAT